MSIEDLNLTTSKDKPSHSIETANEEFEHKLESFLQGEIKKLLQRAVGQPDKKRFVIDQIAKSREVFFQESEDLLDAILAKIETINYDTDVEFEKKVAKELTSVVVTYMASHNISPEKAQINFRIARIENDGDIILDKDGVTYCSRYDDVAEVHITKGLTAPIWTEAISSLLKIVQDDESIKTIKMTSWVVAEKLEFFRKLGFDANLIMDEKELAIIRSHFDEGMRDHFNDPVGEALMSRDKFLNSKILKRIGGI
jgi:hypothetical protein